MREEGKRKHVESHNTTLPGWGLQLEGATCCLAGALLFSQRGSFLRFLPGSPMLSSGKMEEFVTEEEEPWYDQQDLEQGKTRQAPSSLLAASPASAAGAGRSASLPPQNKGSLSCKDTTEMSFSILYWEQSFQHVKVAEEQATIFDNNALKACQAGPVRPEMAPDTVWSRCGLWSKDLFCLIMSRLIDQLGRKLGLIVLNWDHQLSLMKQNA